MMSAAAAAAMMSASHCFRRNRFGTIGRSLGIAGRLLYPAGSSLSLCSRLLGLRGCSFSARSSLVSAVGRVHGTLRWVWLA
jgi:hypothetical protein